MDQLIENGSCGVLLIVSSENLLSIIYLLFIIVLVICILVFSMVCPDVVAHFSLISCVYLYLTVFCMCFCCPTR